MRMWKVDVKKMCRKHLLGEHVEMHMFYGTIKKGNSLNGYLKNGLVETWNIKKRHDKLANELARRGYKHLSPMKCFNIKAAGHVNIEKNKIELHNRCKDCEF